MLNRDRNIKDHQIEILKWKNTMNELNGSIKGFNIRLEQAKVRSSDLEDRSFKIT